MRKRILYIQPYASQVGGVDTVLLELIDGLDKSQFEPLVVLPDYSPYVDKYRMAGAEVLFRPIAVFGKPTDLFYYFRNFLKLFPSVKSIKQIVKEKGIHLIHTHKMEAFGGNIAGKMLGVPTIQTIHELPRFPLAGYKFVGWLNHLFNDRIIVLCDQSKKMFKWGPFVSRKVVKIYNGIGEATQNNNGDISIKKELQLSSSSKLVVTVARISPMKGLDQLIVAAKEVTKTDPTIKFLIVGDVAFEKDSWYKEKICRLVKQYNLSDTVFLLGLRRDVPAILEECDLFVLPSVYDIFPTVILEAMSKALPIVATKVGGTPEMIRSDTGLLVEPNNPLELCEAIKEILINNKGNKLGERAQEVFYEEFTKEKYIKNTTQLYESLLRREGELLNEKSYKA